MSLKTRKTKSNTTVYVVPKTWGTTQLLLHEHEVELLEQLLLHSTMRSLEFVDLATLLRSRAGFNKDREGIELGEKNARLSTANRLMRLKKAGLIKSQSAEDFKGYKLLYKTFFYTYTKKCVNTIFEIGRIDEKTRDRYLKNLDYKSKSQFETPSLHSVATTKLAVTLYSELTEVYASTDFLLCKGSQHPFFMKMDRKLKKVIPDLVLEFPDGRMFAFEVDGGKQLRDVLIDKHARYQQLMKSEYGSNKKLYVIYLPMDNDFLAEDGKGTRVHRLKYIKEVFPPFTNWPSNLNVFVLRYRMIPNFLNRIMDYSEVVKRKQIDFALNEWLFHTQVYLENGYIVEVIKESDLLPRSILNEYSPHKIIAFKQEGKKRRYYFAYYMQNGYIASFQQYNEAVLRIKALNESETFPYEVRLLLVYDSFEEQENDVLNEIRKEDEVISIATSIENWKLHQEEPDSQELHLPIFEQHTRLLSYSLRKEKYRL